MGPQNFRHWLEFSDKKWFGCLVAGDFTGPGRRDNIMVMHLGLEVESLGAVEFSRKHPGSNAP